MRKKCPSMKEGRNIGWKETGLRGGRVVMKRNEPNGENLGRQLVCTHKKA